MKMRRNNNYSGSAAVLSLCLSLFLVSGLSVAHAAESGDGIAAVGTLSDEQEAEPGYTTDEFHIQPEIQLTTYYDDNIYATNRAEVSDFITILSPVLKIHSHWDKHSLAFETGANVGRYLDNPAENYDDYWFEASGTYEFGSNTTLFGDAGYYRKHEGRDSKDSIQSADGPTTYDVQSLGLGGRHRLGQTVIRLVLGYEKLDYDNIGNLFNDDRDRTHNAVGLRVTREIDNRTRIYVQGLFNDRDYVLVTNGVNRDSSGYSAVAGVIRSLGKKGRVESYAGVLSQDYDYDGFETVTTADFGLKLQWYPAESWKLTGNLNRSLRETTDEGASGYLLTKLDLQLEKTLSSKVTAYAAYTYGYYDYQGIARKDDYNAVTLGANYQLSRDVQISGSYSYHDNDSNDGILNPVSGLSYDYSRNLFLLSLKARF
jgi:hypothetical protein